MTSPFDTYAPGYLDTSNEDAELLAAALKVSGMAELGVTGVKRAGGYVDEEFLPQLRGRKAVQTYKEMAENEPLVGALLFTIDRLLRNVEWRVEPGGKTAEDTKAAKHLETCKDDMETSFDDFITEVLSMLPYGWSWHEVVYKRRAGLWQKDPRHMSKFNDGLVGWRKMPIRAQETLLRWAFDERGDVKAMIQLAPPRYQTVPLPIERSMLFRYKHHKGNPEGVSMLRTAYRPWFMKKRLEEFEAIGIERDLAGLPIVKIPAELLQSKPGTEGYKAVENFRKMVKTVRRNEQEGIVFPMAYDQDTKQPLYNLELLGGGGSRAFNVDQVIRRYEERILMTVLADFIMVGHQSVGSYSLHTDKTGIFRTSLNSIAQSIADVLNRQAVPRLFAANGWKLENLPTIVPSDVDSPDIAQLAQFMSAMAQTGVTWFPDPTMENFIRDAARLPKLDEDAQERVHQLQMRTEATEFATANAEYLMAQQQAQMAAQPPEMQAAAEGAQQGTAEAAHAETSGANEKEEAALAQQEAQVGEQSVAGAHERSLKERQMALQERAAQHDEKGSLHDRSLKEKELKIKAKDVAGKATLAQTKAKAAAIKKPAKKK